ncbi:uncharacterized protein LOC133674326 [Populus nigra]|uniref:uncharacterized protein LOC133674326 n=1 Tax=Populus nigra TaxID=3691 RepID=UPI002B26781A|nr:uncharacterized protein LOC133674326 [Populus nigra]
MIYIDRRANETRANLKHNLRQTIKHILAMKEILSRFSKKKPAQCEKCDGLKSDIASLIGKVIEKDIQVSALGKLLALKDEEISRLKSQQNPQLREKIAHKDKKLSRLEDQQLLTDTRMNKLKADIDFVLKEFDEAVKINEEGSDKYSDRSLNNSEKHERLAPTIGIANRHDDKPQSTTPLPHTYERSPPYFPTLKGGSSPLMEENIMVAASSNYNDEPPSSFSMFNDDSTLPTEAKITVAPLSDRTASLTSNSSRTTEQNIKVAAPLSSHDIIPPYVPRFHASPTAEGNITVTAPSSHANGRANGDGKLHIFYDSLYGLHRPPTPYPFYVLKKKNKNNVVK